MAIKETGFGCVRYSKKTGKVDFTATAMGDAMLNMWALQNTKAKTKETVVFDLETGIISRRYSGTGDFPNIEKDVNEQIDESVRLALAEDWANRK